MTHSRVSTVLAAALLTAALAVGTVPAIAAPQPVQPSPVATAPAEPLPTEAGSAPAQPSPAGPAAEQTTDGEPVAPVPPTTPVPAPAPTQTPEPVTTTEAAAPELTAAELAANPEALAELIGPHGASLGQGVERLAESGDAQIPTSRELQEDGAVQELGRMSAAQVNPWRPQGIVGVDVSSHQGNVNWSAVWNQGSKFAYTKATEALSYKNPNFNQQYTGSANVGMLRGAYHFAIPSISSGAAQANYFINNGGGWTADGRTLPPLLDVEYNPYPSLGNSCYNMSPSQMVTWIRDFSNTMLNRTGRVPMIYTTTDWWNTCTGNSAAFTNHPLHIAAYNNVGAGRLPAGWNTYSLWQYTSQGPVVGDWNVWNGTSAALQEFARNSRTGAQLYFRGQTSAPTYFATSRDQFIACDWNGDGVSTPASFNNGVWTFRQDLQSAATSRAVFGAAGDQPICGDWDGDGRDSLGVYRQGVAMVRNSNSSGAVDGTIRFGARGDVAVVGDWNGDGYDTLGVTRTAVNAKRFYLTNSNLAPGNGSTFLFGNASDTAIAGDWNNDGYATVGVKRGGQWYKANSNLQVRTDVSYSFGNPSDKPLVGSWRPGTGDTAGVAR